MGPSHQSVLDGPPPAFRRRAVRSAPRSTPTFPAKNGPGPNLLADPGAWATAAPPFSILILGSHFAHARSGRARADSLSDPGPWRRATGTKPSCAWAWAPPHAPLHLRATAGPHVSALGGPLLEWLPGHDGAPDFGDKNCSGCGLRWAGLGHGPADQLGGLNFLFQSDLEVPLLCPLQRVEVGIDPSWLRDFAS